MTKPLLIIGNKNYSSWSLRPWMALAQAGIEFDEKLIPFGEPKFSRAVKRISKNGLVPILQHDGMTIWESLAILEYIAETWPEKNLWPKKKQARALARSMCSEMHAGFRNLRNACPMNIRRAAKPLASPLSEGVLADVKRIETIWAQAREEYGKAGPFLFGKFTNADAMFTPVASRIETFAIPVSKQTRAYVDTLLNTKAFQKWKATALLETQIYAADEVD